MVDITRMPKTALDTQLAKLRERREGKIPVQEIDSPDIDMPWDDLSDQTEVPNLSREEAEAVLRRKTMPLETFVRNGQAAQKSVDAIIRAQAKEASSPEVRQASPKLAKNSKASPRFNPDCPCCVANREWRSEASKRSRKKLMAELAELRKLKGA